jgi:multidrug efflux pump subunit AcrA (membrane-fusion protein)
MLLSRHKRTAAWLLALGGLASGLFLIEIEDWVTGPFHVRSAVRTELRAPAAGFIREVRFDEGDRVSPGAVVVRLEVPDLPARLAQKRAEVREAEAKLRLLEEGSRPEELAQQRDRVERARAWRDLAAKDLTRAGEALKEDLARFDSAAAQHRAEVTAAAAARDRAAKGSGVVSNAETAECDRRLRVAQALLDQSLAERRAREARGTSEAEAELARREKELADSQAVLDFLRSGSRPGEVAAQSARLAGIKEEVRQLEDLQGRLTVTCPAGGVVSTPRLREKVGQYVREGDPICVVEEPDRLEVEVALAEEKVARVAPGQAVSLKARSLPFGTHAVTVDPVAIAAARGDPQSTLTVYCLLESRSGLRPGLTGHARVYTDRRSVGGILFDQMARTLRSELWW